MQRCIAPRLRPGLRLERVGDELVVLDQASHRVHRLTGPAADAVTRLAEGSQGTSVPAEVLEALRAAGIIDGALSRRRALGASAAAGLGVVSMALPAAFAAASGGGGGSSSLTVSGGTLVTPLVDGEPIGGVVDITYRTFTSDGTLSLKGSGTLLVDILVIGGGGGGGGGDLNSGGSGGAGGAVSIARSVTLGVADYDVVVGEGGAGGSPYTQGRAGSQSSFDLGGARELTAPGGGLGTTPNADGRADGGSVAAGTSGSSARAGGVGSGRFVLDLDDQRGAGGGAGAGGAGGDSVAVDRFTTDFGGDGGPGFGVTGFFAATESFAGGGGGAGSTGGSAVAGGGAGATGSSNGTSANSYGGGGGGGGDYSAGGAGANGLVVIRYVAP